MSKPFVSIIIPTTRDRIAYNKAILNSCIRQDYPFKEILFDFDGGTIGAKRNRLCARAHGSIIIHNDSDDLYRPDWVSKSVQFLLEKNADITGINKAYFYDQEKQEYYLYQYKSDGNTQPYAIGASLCYLKSWWEACPFPDQQVAEDLKFITGTVKDGKFIKPILVPHDYSEGFLGSIHSGNTSPRMISVKNNYRECTEEEIKGIKERFY